MPCDTVTTYGIDLGKLDPGTLMRGLTKDGHAPVQTGDIITWTQDRQPMTYNTKTGQLEVQSSAWQRSKAPEAITAAIKQSFSRQLARDQFTKRGWQVKETNGKFVMLRNTI